MQWPSDVVMTGWGVSGMSLRLIIRGSDEELHREEASDDYSEDEVRCLGKTSLTVEAVLDGWRGRYETLKHNASGRTPKPTRNNFKKLRDHA